MAKGRGIRAVCGTLMGAMIVALGISGAAADESEAPPDEGPSDAGDATSKSTAGSGRVLWSRQLGTSASDLAYDVATDKEGNVCVAGWTTRARRTDGWVIKLDGDGQTLCSRQPGTGEVRGVATDTDGNVYVVGYTRGALGGAKKGSLYDLDAWIIKYAR